MSETAIQLLSGVLALPENERLAVRDALDGSLTPGDDALFAELERRRAEHESGNDPGTPADDVFRRLEAKGS
jgi:putative addiction module component (TIGR02574 family)